MSLEDRQTTCGTVGSPRSQRRIPARLALSSRPFTFKVKIVGAIVVSMSTSFIVDENE